MAAMGIFGYASSVEMAVKVAEGTITTDSVGEIGSAISPFNSLIVTAIGGTGMVIGGGNLLSNKR